VTPAEKDPNSGGKAEEPLDHESAFTVLNRKAVMSLYKVMKRSQEIPPTPFSVGIEFQPIEQVRAKRSKE
jgi:hypothetical protein